MLKFCSKCQKAYVDEPGAICPVCGSSLIEIPVNQPDNSSKLDMGDANAISGGVHMADNHSVNHNSVSNSTSNVDSHNVITNNITQVERQKTPEEMWQEKIDTFKKACLDVFSDGIMTSEERRKLDLLQFQLDIDEATASQIREDVSKRYARKLSSLTIPHKIAFENIKRYIKANRLDMINRLMPQLKAMVQRYSVEEIQYTYYMLQAVLHPEDCAKEYNDRRDDKYWQTFWSSIAFRRVGNIESSELLVTDVSDKWLDTIPQENALILAAVNAILDGDLETAKTLYENIVGNHSVYLSNLSTGLCTIVNSDALSPEDLKEYQKECKFYLQNLLSDATKCFSEDKPQKKEASGKVESAEKDTAKKPKEKKVTKATVQEGPHYDENVIVPLLDRYGYLRDLDASEIVKMKPILQSAPKDNYRALFFLGQIYLQENNSAINAMKAYDALKLASEHGVYKAGAFMAYFYLYGKNVAQDLEEAERRIRLDSDYKKNPIYLRMLVELYKLKGNPMLADVWNTKLRRAQKHD